jgi:hypothetical protein
MVTAGSIRSFRARAEEWANPAIEADAVLLFRRFFATKTALWTFVKIGTFQELINNTQQMSFAIAAVLGAVLCWPKKRYHLGAAILLGLAFYRDIILFFPRTANHNFVESLVFFGLLVFPSQKAPPEDGREMVYNAGVRVIQCVTAAAVFYSGLQKIWHGQWHDAECIAYFQLFDKDTKLMYSWSPGLYIGDFLFGTSAASSIPIPRANVLGRYAYTFPAWTQYYFLFLSWSALVIEVFGPLLVLFKRTRKLGFITITVCIALFSALAGVYGFTMTGVSASLLYFPKHAKRNFKILIAFLAVGFITLYICQLYFKLPFVWK